MTKRVKKAKAKSFTNDYGRDANQNILNIITPSGIDFDRSHLNISENVGTVLCISKYPADAGYGWLMPVCNLEGTGTTIEFRYSSPDKLAKQLNKRISELRENYETAKQESEKQGILNSIENLKELINKIVVKGEPVGYVNVMLYVTAENSSELQSRIKRVQSALSIVECGARTLIYKQDMAFKAMAPYGLPNYEMVSNVGERPMPISTLVGGYPNASSGLNDIGGYYLGKTKEHNLVIMNQWIRNKDRTNSNWIVTGVPGVGKSTALKNIFVKEYFLGTKVIIFDPEREYVDTTLSSYINGDVIDCASGITGRINPLQIRVAGKVTVEDLEEGENLSDYYGEHEGSDLALYLQQLRLFFALYFGKDDFTAEIRTVLEQTLIELYAQYGITWETDVSQLKNEAFPIMENLYDLAAKKAEEETNEYWKGLRDQLALKLFSCGKGADREYGTDDDFVYTQDDQMRGDKVYAGADGIFTSSGEYQKSSDDWTYLSSKNDLIMHPGADNNIETQDDNDVWWTGVDKKTGQTDTMADDKLVNAGKDGAYITNDDFIDIEDGSNMRPGADNKFGTEDDFIANNGPDKVAGNADDYIHFEDKYINRRPGEDNAFAASDLKDSGTDDAFYWDGLDKTPGTDDDVAIYAGDDNECGTPDDFYVFTKAPYKGTSVFAGEDGLFGTEDDFARLPDGTVLHPGADALLGTIDDFKQADDGTRQYPGADLQFGTDDDRYQTVDEIEQSLNHDKDGVRYENGADKVPGSEDDVRIQTDPDGAEYIPGTGEETGNKQYSGVDKEYNSEDDKWQSPEEEAKNQNHDKDGNSYTDGADKIPGTEDDELIHAGNPPYADAPDGNKHYPGVDNVFDTEDDRWQTAEEEENGLNHDKEGNLHSNGADGKPGTADDKAQQTDSAGNVYIEDEDGNRRYPAADDRYYTEDDRFKTESEVQDKTNHDSAGNRYTDGADKLPGTEDDVAIRNDGKGEYIPGTGAEEGNKHYPGVDKNYGTDDDKWQTTEEKAARKNHDKDGNQYLDGSDALPGTEDDVLIRDDGKGEYIPGTEAEEGNKQYPGKDGEYGSEDDKWQSPEEEENSQNHDKNGNRYDNGPDGKPGTEDDILIQKDENGNDYIVDADGNRRYPAADDTFHTEDDRFKTEAEVARGENHDADGNRYLDGADKKPGTADDIDIYDDGKGEYVIATGSEAGNKQYPGIDKNYDTDDDKWQTPEEEQHAQNHDRDGNRYDNGSDGKPGTDDDLPITSGENGTFIPGSGMEEGNKQYPGEDGIFGNEDDRYQAPGEETKNQNHDSNGNRYDNGPDGKPGTADDILIQKDENSTDYITDFDGRRHYPGADGIFSHPGADGVYGVTDDRWKTEGDIKNNYNRDKEDILYRDGKDNVPGTLDDTRVRTSGGSGGGGGSSRGVSVNKTNAATGTWEIADEALGKWTYRFTDGNTPKDTWVMLYWKDTDTNGWYHFDTQGIMQTGWFMDKDGTWYHLHTQSDGRRGSMDTGWVYEEEDKHWYYLGTDGKMRVGWQKVGEKWYYLNEDAPVNTWIIDPITGRYTYTAKGQRPYGSMYEAETTPDGYSVDESGKWVK